MPTPPADEEELSRRRLGLIVAYAKDPASDPLFADRPAFYRLLAQERAYQQDRARALEALRDVARAAGDVVVLGSLEAELATALDRQAKVFKYMKELTGKRGRTGGTGLLPTAPRVVPAPLVRKVVTGRNAGPDMALSRDARAIDVPVAPVAVPAPAVEGAFADLLGAEPPGNPPTAP